ncbi:hypothetical protein [Bradyrhizobium japonicum]|uniref:hypothetical protein n=1 Tax=Bradyrhizobium japonicum TaxID=375 RepID=UPI000580A31A|nr:hypothetical protein [Bradyrhizobium japonicum]MCD9110982.1 hypothetical protein [Bradyrhizobium japonicum]MCD9256639.1 hypothetical protein [Bradyrhizobium japonicum SEMIA 5079]MCD9823860.1 hypothetical protein [Bradyrhizobium japonicum]MCD9896155.1 hypothetical protein [Bradyrhizobium japonicum]MCD9911474.1 hypothetical protein [Bradyrhizobium japonicum]
MRRRFSISTRPIEGADGGASSPPSGFHGCWTPRIELPIGWQIYALTGCAYSLGLAGLDHRADGDGHHTIRVALVRLGEFESGMTAALLGAIPAVVLDGVGTTDVGRSLS